MLRQFLARLLAAAGSRSPRPAGSAEEHAARFEAHRAKGDYAGAAEALQAALRVRPDWTDARYNLGSVLMQLGRYAEAEAAYRRVIGAEPDRLLAYRMLGNVLHRQGRIAQLLDVLAKARRAHPEDFDLESFELLALLFSDALPAEELFARHRAFGARLEAATPPLASAPRPGADQRLRIGYLSGDICTHPVAQFLQPVVERHDRSRFEVFCYSVGTTVDALTRAIASRADIWREAAGFADARLADSIRADRIDVLVDLSGHSGLSRLGVFARQPARVQVAWLGYLHSTGLTRIQYRICDRHTDPEGSAERLHTETLVRLPESQWCYRPLLDTAAPGARAGAFTFGSFNQVAKITPTSRRLWAQILRGMPQARMVLLGIPDGAAREDLLRDLREGGVDASRLELAPHLPVAQYLRRLGEVDVALDTTPYSGGTTTCDCLWMGVPVVTLAGERSASRSAASILQTARLGDWVARTPEEYVAIALGAGREPGRLAALRTTLRQRMRASPLMDEARFVRDLEDIYRRLAYS
jgi:predicted O-linked N-acetylglucosamine transferase (SPINDLY family)